MTKDGITQDGKKINAKFPFFYCFAMNLKDQVADLVKIQLVLIAGELFAIGNRARLDSLT